MFIYLHLNLLFTVVKIVVAPHVYLSSPQTSVGVDDMDYIDDNDDKCHTTSHDRAQVTVS